MRKKTSMAILAALVACVVLLAAGGAAAASNGVEYDERTYYGEELTESTVGLFRTELDLSVSDLLTPFLEFVIVPETRGSGTSVTETPQQYTPDFERLTFTFTEIERPENTMTIVLYPRKQDGNYATAVNAAGTGQTARGEAMVSADPITLEQNTGGTIPYSFDGWARENQRYMDAAGEWVPIGAHGSIRLYYDSAENALYTDMGFRSATGSRTGEAGAYRWRVRDFDKTDYADNTEPAWAGFTGPVEMTVAFDEIADGRSPCVVILSAGQTTFYEPLYASAVTDGVAGTAYPVPAPVSYDGVSYTTGAFAGTYAVTAPDGSEAVGETAYAPDSVFTPQTEGTYTITYTTGKDSVVLPVTVHPAGTEGTVLTPVSAGRIVYPGDTVDAGVTVTNALQTEQPSATLTVERDGTPIRTGDIGTSETFAFDLAGEYVFRYASTDLLGRTVTCTEIYSVRRYYAIRSAPSDGTLYALGETVPVSAADFTLYDVVTDLVCTPRTCDITVSFAGGEYLPLASVDFAAEGEYRIRYEMTYYADDLYTAEAERKVYVYKEALAPIGTAGLPVNTRLIEDGAVLRVKTVVGASVRFPYGYFSGAETVVLSYGATETNVTAAFGAGEYTFVPEAEGIYTFTAQASDGVYRVSKAVSIDVRHKWYEAADVSGRTAELGAVVGDLMPEIIDFFGNRASGGTTQVSYNGTSVGSDSFTASHAGLYTVTYVYTADGETISGSYMIRVDDTAAPSVTLTNVDDGARTGQFVRIADVTAEDNSGRGSTIAVSVTYDGEPVQLYNGGFTAHGKGEYTVIVTVTDTFGNSATESYTVTVHGWGGVIALSVTGGVLVLGGGILAVLLIIRHKKRGAAARTKETTI